MKITKNDFIDTFKGKPICGEVLIKDYHIALTKNGAEYITGTILAEVSIPFKAWGNSTAFSKLKEYDYENRPCRITGEFDNFGGVSVIISNVDDASESYKIEDFLPVRYNTEAYSKGLQNLCKSKLSDKGYALLDKVLFSSDCYDKFKVEFAAKNHHDNCKSGLLAHTYKVLNNVILILNQYPHIAPKTESTDLQDLIIIGAVVHDIGKIWEMNYGTYQDISIVKHQYLGAEYISKFKPEIVSTYDDIWYYNLISILLQHHGEFGEDCKTVYAQVVHMADKLDADLTTLNDSIANASDSVINFNGKYLNI